MTSSNCIWYICKYVSPPGKGSAGARGYQLMRELAASGANVVIMTSDANHLAELPDLDATYTRQSVDGMDLWWIRTMKYSAVRSVRRIASWLDFEWKLYRMPRQALPHPDVVIVSSLSLLTILNGAFMRRRYGCRLIFEVRDIWPLTLIEEGGFSSFNPLIKLLGGVERFGYRTADVIVGTMPNLGEHVTKVLGYERPVACVPMGVDEQLANNSEPLPEKFINEHMPRGKFVVAHVGSIGATNALETFLRCAEGLRERDDIHFLLVGGGDLREEYRQRYRNLANVSFGDRVPKEMVQSVLNRCDLLYFATHTSEVWRYGQSLNKVVDYMLAGRPIVASYAGFPSMINEARCGTFVPPGDVQALEQELVRFAEMDRQERLRMGERGRDWILANRSYADLAALYHRIIFPADQIEHSQVVEQDTLTG